LNLADVKQKTTIFIREYSNNNALIGSIQNGDYLLSIPFLADSAQKEIATVKKIPKIYKISQFPAVNQLGLLAGHDIVEYLNTDIVNTSAKGSKSYYFEVDNIATIHVEEEINGVWTNLETLSNTTKGKYTAYKGLIIASDTSNNIRLRFTGSYPYRIRNRALFAYAYPTVDDIPNFKPYQEYEMPLDFMDLDKIVHTANNRQRLGYIGGQWINKRTYVLNYYEKGEFEVQYWAYPSKVTTDDAYEFEVDTEAQELIPLYCAGHVVKDEDLSISVSMLNEYEKRLSRLANSDIYQYSVINDTTGW
jgi:hypothetical protein